MILTARVVETWGEMDQREVKFIVALMDCVLGSKFLELWKVVTSVDHDFAVGQGVFFRPHLFPTCTRAGGVSDASGCCRDGSCSIACF